MVSRVRPGSGFGLAPELRRGGGIVQEVPGSRTRIRRAAMGQSGDAEQVFDPRTGRVLGTRIVRGTERVNKLREQRQEDLFAKILGGTEAGFFPVIDPATGENLASQVDTLSPAQALQLRSLGFTPVGGSALFNPDLSAAGPREPSPTGGGAFGGGFQGIAGAPASAASARPGRDAGGGIPLPVIIAGAVAALLLLR